MSKAKKKTPQNRLGRALRFVSTMLTASVLCLNVAVILLLLTCGLCTFVSPATAPRLGLFCLFYPVFVLTDAIFIFVWLLIRWRMAMVSVAGLLLSAPFTQSYCPVHLPGSSKSAADARVLKVMTFNSHYFKEMDGGWKGTEHTFFQLLQRDTFDIIAIQEGEQSLSYRSVVDPFMEQHGYTRIMAQGARHEGNMLFTRHKPIDAKALPMPTRETNIATLYRILIDDDTLTLANIHLESYHLENPAKEQYRSALHQLNADTTRNTGRFMVNLMKPAMKMHGEQIDSVLEYIEPLAERGEMVVLCGDFNDSPVSYACRRARSALTDAYRAAGRGPGFTYHEEGMPFRIDHIFVSDRLRPLKTWVETSVLESDHYPLATILEVLPQKTKDEG